MESSERARDLFARGTNCAQAVFAGCAHGRMGGAEMLKVASCLGGGMSHTDHACGALTGGLLAIGAAAGMDRAGDTEAKERAGEVGARFVSLFRERFGSTRCTDLIGYNLSDDTQLEAAREAGVFSETCPVFVEGATQLVELVLRG